MIVNEINKTINCTPKLHIKFDKGIFLETDISINLLYHLGVNGEQYTSSLSKILVDSPPVELYIISGYQYPKVCEKYDSI